MQAGERDRALGELRSQLDDPREPWRARTPTRGRGEHDRKRRRTSGGPVSAPCRQHAAGPRLGRGQGPRTQHCRSGTQPTDDQPLNPGAPHDVPSWMGDGRAGRGKARFPAMPAAAQAAHCGPRTPAPALQGDALSESFDEPSRPIGGCATSTKLHALPSASRAPHAAAWANMIGGPCGVPQAARLAAAGRPAGPRLLRGRAKDRNRHSASSAVSSKDAAAGSAARSRLAPGRADGPHSPTHN